MNYTSQEAKLFNLSNYLSKMNPLQQWETKFREEIIQDLKEEGIEFKKENIEEIIKATSFKERSRKYQDKCPYYSMGHSCHPKIPELNCFLCACPNYNSNEEIGGCKIKSPMGKFHFHKNLPRGKVWDCSYCSINHSAEEVRKYLTNLFS